MNSGLAQRQFLEGKKIGIVINDADIKIKRLRCVPVRLNFMPRVSFIKCYLTDCFFFRREKLAQISTFGGGSSNTTRSEKGELLKYKFLSNSIS